MKKRVGFEVVRMTEQDAHQIMEWRNDPETLRMSRHTQPKVWNSFYKEFINDYFISPELPPLFFLEDGQRKAFLGFKQIDHPENQPERRCVEIAINVAPEYRQQGIGTAALEAATEWLQQQGFDDILAKVKPENSASQKAFLAAGYQQIENTIYTLEKTGEKITLYRYLKRITPTQKQAHVFIIAEAGSNWRVGTPAKDLEMAKALIDCAAEAGADAIKFQTYRPETIYVANAGMSDYLSDAGIKRDMKDIFSDLAMPYEMIPLLAEHCQKKNIEFMSTAFSKEDFLAVDPHVKRHKIASYEIGHIRLIELAARSGKPTLMSTGAATEEEIRWAVQTYRELGGKNLTLLQCTAKYPADPDSMNLKTIPWLKNRFKCPVGLSDHSLHPFLAPVVAVALGARVIEKHFTIDRSLPGPDHSFAIMPLELKELVFHIRQAEQMLGNEVKTVHPSENELRHFAKRGIQAIRDIKKGDILKEDENIAILRPGKQKQGVHPKYIQEIGGKKATHDIPLGSGLQQGDWE